MSEIVWVQRNADGEIVGVYANEQEGYAEEQLPADDPEVVAFRNPPPPTPVPSPQDQVLFDHENRIRAQEGAPPLSLADFTKKMTP